MAGNSFGTVFKVTTFGESHGPGLGVVVDGCPSGLRFSEAVAQAELDRRKPGGSRLSTARREADRVSILSGIFEGLTTGAPIGMVIMNDDAKSKDYEKLRHVFRPGHADITLAAKYGLRDHRGGGRSSARETAARVAAGAVAKALLASESISVTAYTLELAGVRVTKVDLSVLENNEFRMPDLDVMERLNLRLGEVRKAGDSVGGLIEVRVTGCPAGLGEPVFDKLDADLAKAIMSIGAVKAVEIGAGLEVARALGSQNNDPITPRGFATNNAGGILGGISNGDEILVRAAVKPIPSIAQVQDTIDDFGASTQIAIGGRHDASAIPRILPVAEAMASLVIADHLLRQRTAKA